MALAKVVRPFRIDGLSSYIVHSDFACLNDLVSCGYVGHQLSIKDKYCASCKEHTDINENIYLTFLSIDLGVHVLKEIELLEGLLSDISWNYYPESLQGYAKYRDLYTGLFPRGKTIDSYLAETPERKNQFLQSICSDFESDRIHFLVKRISRVLSNLVAKYKSKGFPVGRWYENYRLNSRVFVEQLAVYYIEKHAENRRRRRNNHIQKIFVKKLFGYHSYILDLSKKDYSVIIGTNGLGKTTVFNILECLLVDTKTLLSRHSRIEQVNRVPFEEIKVSFENGISIFLKKTPYLEIEVLGKEVEFSWKIDPEVFIAAESIAVFDRRNKNILQLYADLEIVETKGLIESYIESLSEYFYIINKLFPTMDTDNGFLPRFHFIRTRRDDLREREGIYQKCYETSIKKWLASNDKTFQHFQKDFEDFYFENDPSRKTVCYKNGQLVALLSRKVLDGGGRVKRILAFDEHYSCEANEIVTEPVIIPLECLSSGELNVLAVLFDLHFRCQHDAIILIDEPEISLHIAWQQKLGERLERVISNHEKKSAQIIVATHSPFIVSSHPECVVEAELIF